MLHEESELQHTTIMKLKESNTDLTEQLADADAKFKRLKAQAKSKIKAAEDKAAKGAAKAKGAASSAAGSAAANPRGTEAAAPPADGDELLKMVADAKAEQERLAALLEAETASKDELQAKATQTEAEQARLLALLEARNAAADALQARVDALEGVARQSATSSGIAQEQLTESVAKLNDLLAEQENFASDRAELEEELEAKGAAIAARDGAIEELNKALGKEQAALAAATKIQRDLEQKTATLESATAAAAAVAAAQVETEAEVHASTNSGSQHGDDDMGAELQAAKDTHAVTLLELEKVSAERDANAAASAAERSALEAKVLKLSATISEANDGATAAKASAGADHEVATAATATGAAEMLALEAKAEALATKHESSVAALSAARDEVAGISSERDLAVQEQAKLEEQVIVLRSKLEEAVAELSTSASNTVELDKAHSSLAIMSANVAAAQLLANQYSAEMSESVVREAELQEVIDSQKSRSGADATTIHDLRQKLEAAATMVKQSEIKLGNMTTERGRLVASVEKAGARREDALESMRGEFEAQLKAKEDELQVYLEQIREAEDTLETIEIQADKERDDAELAKEALDEADAKVAVMESQTAKLEAEKKESERVSKEASVRLVDVEALLAASQAKEEMLQDQLQGTESESKEALEAALVEVARLTSVQTQSQKEIDMHTNSAAALQLALRTAEQQVARSEEQYLGLTNEVELLNLQREESSASLDREQQASESKLQAAESEIEDLTQRLYDKSNRTAALEAELEAERFKLAKSQEAAASAATLTVVSTSTSKETAEDQAAEVQRELSQARDQLAAALKEAALTREQLVEVTAAATEAKTVASQAAAALSSSTLSFESSKRDMAAAAEVDRQTFAHRFAAREAALEKRVAELQEEAVATAAQLAVLVRPDSVAINIDATAATAAGATVKSTTIKANKGWALEGAKNLARVFMCYRLDPQMQLYLLCVHVAMLYLLFLK